MSTPKRAAIYGPEPWLTHSGAVWSRCDLWFCLVACLDHDIDIARATFAAADRPGMQQRYLRERCIELTGSPPVPPS